MMMKRIMMAMLTMHIIGTPFLKAEIKIINGSKNEICIDYKNNLKSTKFRNFHKKYASKYFRPKWKKLRLTDKNRTLFKRVYTYKNKMGLSFANYDFNDRYTNDVFYKKYFNKNTNHYFSTKIDIDFDGNKETLVRYINDGVPLDEDGHSKKFSTYIVVVNEEEQSVNIHKTKILRQFFRKHYNLYKIPHQDQETDTNIFMLKKRIFIDTYWNRWLIQPHLNPLVQIVELTKNGKKENCLLEIQYYKGKKDVK
jgi:hypothetical protein